MFKWTNKKKQQNTVFNPIPPLLWFFSTFLHFHPLLCFGTMPSSCPSSSAPPAWHIPQLGYGKSSTQKVPLGIYNPIWFSIWNMSMNFLYIVLGFLEDLSQDCLPVFMLFIFGETLQKVTCLFDPPWGATFISYHWICIDLRYKILLINMSTK